MGNVELESKSESKPIGEIKVLLTGDGIQVDSALPIPEVVFWLECAKQLVVDNFLDGGNAPG